MKRSILLLAFLTLLVVAGGVPVASAEDVTVALSSLSTETLDPVLGGHVVKFYLDQIFDYLVGVTADGQLSADGGIATRWEPSPDHKRWTFQLRRGVKFHNGDDLTSDDVKFSLLRDGQALDDRLRGAAARADQGHRDAGAGPRGDRDEGADVDHSAVPVPRARDRRHDRAEEVSRSPRRRRLRPQPGRQRAVSL